MPSLPEAPKPKSLLKAAIEHTSTDNEDDVPNDVVKFSDRAADFVAKWYGSWVAFWASMGVIGAWILLNSYAIHVYSINVEHFDPYPYFILNFSLTIVSTMAQVFILMSQNRSGQRDSAILEEITMTTMRAEAVLLEIENGFGILSSNQHDMLTLQSSIVDALTALSKSIRTNTDMNMANSDLLITMKEIQTPISEDKH